MTTLDMVGDGGIFTTVEDMSLWDQNFYKNKLVGDEIIKKMLVTGKLNNGKKLDYTFGLMVTTYRGLNIIRHGGAFVGFRAEMIRFPEQKLSVVCLANLGTINPSRLCNQIANIYFSDLFKEDPQEKQTSETNAINLSEEELKNKVGNYEDKESGVTATITFQRGRLYIEAFGDKFPLIVESNSEFRTENAPVDVKVKFTRQIKDEKWDMQLIIEGNEPHNLKSVDYVILTSSQLEEYTGKYFSDELQTYYVLAVENDRLLFKHRTAPQSPLKPTFKDKFRIGRQRFEFLRDDQNNICCFLS